MTKIVIGGSYKHYSRGNIYKVLYVGRDSDTLEDVVVYQGQYDSEEFGNRPIWVRSRAAFCESVIVDGKEVPRFQYVDG